MVSDLDVAFQESPRAALEAAHAARLVFQVRACVGASAVPGVLMAMVCTTPGAGVTQGSRRPILWRFQLAHHVAAPFARCESCLITPTHNAFPYPYVIGSVRAWVQMFAVLSANAATGHFIPYTRGEQDVLESMFVLSVGRASAGRSLQASAPRQSSTSHRAPASAGPVGSRHHIEFSTPDITLPKHLHHFYHGCMPRERVTHRYQAQNDLLEQKGPTKPLGA